MPGVMPTPPTPPQPPLPEPPLPPPPPPPPPPVIEPPLGSVGTTSAGARADASPVPEENEPSTGVTESNTETEIRTLQPRPGDIVAGRGAAGGVA